MGEALQKRLPVSMRLNRPELMAEIVSMIQHNAHALAQEGSTAFTATRWSVYGISDLHVDSLANLRTVERLCAQHQTNQAVTDESSATCLLLAGDVSSNVDRFRYTLQLLVSRYDRVVYVPGNHCLWVSEGEQWMKQPAAHCQKKQAEAVQYSHPQRGEYTSIDKLLLLIQICTEEGVHVSEIELHCAESDASARVVPLLSWHAADFVTPVNDQLLSNAERWFDAGAKWPITVNNDAREQRNSVSTSIAQFFADINQQLINPNVHKQRGHRCTLITMSHFIPKAFLPYPGFLSNVMGDSQRLGAQLDALGPDIHLFGHSHNNADATFDGARYVQHALGYPREQLFGLLTPSPKPLLTLRK